VPEVLVLGRASRSGARRSRARYPGPPIERYDRHPAARRPNTSRHHRRPRAGFAPARHRLPLRLSGRWTSSRAAWAHPCPSERFTPADSPPDAPCASRCVEAQVRCSPSLIVGDSPRFGLSPPRESFHDRGRARPMRREPALPLRPRRLPRSCRRTASPSAHPPAPVAAPPTALSRAARASLRSGLALTKRSGSTCRTSDWAGARSASWARATVERNRPLSAHSKVARSPSCSISRRAGAATPCSLRGEARAVGGDERCSSGRPSALSPRTVQRATTARSRVRYPRRHRREPPRIGPRSPPLLDAGADCAAIQECRATPRLPARRSHAFHPRSLGGRSSSGPTPVPGQIAEEQSLRRGSATPYCSSVRWG